MYVHIISICKKCIENTLFESKCLRALILRIWEKGAHKHMGISTHIYRESEKDVHTYIYTYIHP